MTTERLMAINEIKFDQDLYPRQFEDSEIVNIYLSAMQRGDSFPPIVVGTIGENTYAHYLIDGKHRIGALKLKGDTDVTATILHFENKGEAFAEAVRLNTVHGKPLSWTERSMAMRKLLDLGFAKERIDEVCRPSIRLSRATIGETTKVLRSSAPAGMPEPGEEEDPDPSADLGRALQHDRPPLERFSRSEHGAAPHGHSPHPEVEKLFDRGMTSIVEIADETGLTEGQVRYCLDKTGRKPIASHIDSTPNLSKSLPKRSAPKFSEDDSAIFTIEAFVELLGGKLNTKNPKIKQLLEQARDLIKKNLGAKKK